MIATAIICYFLLLAMVIYLALRVERLEARQKIHEALIDNLYQRTNK